MSTSGKMIVTNRKALRDYSILEKFEAGIVLTGTEVKSLRNKGGNLSDSFARVVNGALWLHNFHISPYAFGNSQNHEPLATRKLLLHKHEIERLIGLQQQKGYTLIPLKLYFKGSLIKVEIGIGKGKAEYDKRDTIKKKEHDREMQKALKYKNR